MHHVFQKQMTTAKFCSVGLRCALYQFSKFVFTFLTAFPVQRCIHWHLVLLFPHDIMTVKMKERALCQRLNGQVFFGIVRTHKFNFTLSQSLNIY